MCVKAVGTCSFIFNFVSGWCKTQEMCDKDVSEDPFVLEYCHGRYKTQEMCNMCIKMCSRLVCYK